MNDIYECDGAHSFDEFTLVNLKDDAIISRLDQILIKKRNSEGWTLLMYACNNGHKSLVKHLIKHGVTISNLGPRTPLMLAVGSGDFDIVRLVFNFSDLEVKDKRGWTALFYAVFYGREKIANYLLSQGAKTNSVDIFGQTPTHLAVKYGMEEIVAILLSAGKNENKTPSRTPQRQTPKAKTSLFRNIKTYSPNNRPTSGLKSNQKENSPAVLNVAETHAKKLNFLAPTLPPRTPKTPNNTPTSTVLALLIDLKLEKYWPIFRDEEIDFDTLMTFNEENLNDIGIKLYGPRKKILKAIQEYCELHGSTSRLLTNFMWLKS